MNREAHLRGGMDEILLPLPHLLPFPAFDGTLVNRQRRIWNHQPLIYSQTTAETFAPRTGSIRIIEIEKHIRRFDKFQSVCLETL